MGLVELIVALGVLSVALLGLAGTAAFAHRSFASAEAFDEGVVSAASVLDSLLRVAAPSDGATVRGRHVLRWTVSPDSIGASILLTVEIRDGGRVQTVTFHAYHAAP